MAQSRKPAHAVSEGHDLDHHGEPVKVGPYTVLAGGIRLSEASLANTDVLMTLCDKLPPNLGSREVIHRHFIIEDFGVSNYLEAYLRTHILGDLAEGRRLAIHCQGGFGRTGMVLGGLIALLEPEVENPVAEVRKRYCPWAIENVQQEAWVSDLQKKVLAERQASSDTTKGVIPMSAPDATKNEWYMAGTEGTGKYLVIGTNDAGRLGIRLLKNGTVRIRIEPVSEESSRLLAEHFTVEDGWKQPDPNQKRFSRVSPKGRKTIKTVASALKVLKRTGGKLTRQPSLRFGRWIFHTA